MSNRIVIHWFRQDLRLSDNPALFAAANDSSIFPIYILDDECAGKYRMGAASRFWLHHSLNALNQALGGNLSVYRGKAEIILMEIVKKYKVAAVHWNRCYEPWRIKRDVLIKKALIDNGVEVNSFNGSLLWEPWEIRKSDGLPYRVFTKFYRNGCLGANAPREPLPTPSFHSIIVDKEYSQTIASLELLPKIPWDQQLIPHWEIGEIGAQKRLEVFLSEGISTYKEGRNFPIRKSVSRLSPHLHFGELSPNQAWYAARLCEYDDNVDTFCSELGWREFSYSLLYYNPDLPEQNLQKKFDAFLWQDDDKALNLWRMGQTGIPIVDAGMRELWQTGYMHNRVRMIVGSFLVKNLLLNWRHGERWFWDCLVDADLASNSASWQWVAGTGADAAPYFRIFNPVTQGQKFDPDGHYTRYYVPELKNLPDKYLFNPWEAPDSVLASAEIELGKTYPRPIVDLKFSRERALNIFKSLS